jgi:hypothetical protein
VPPLLLLVCLFVVLALFFHVEKTQTDLSRHFGQRTISIEAVLSLNRHEAEEEEASRERTSDPLGPEFCVGHREVPDEA